MRTRNFRTAVCNLLLRDGQIASDAGQTLAGAAQTGFDVIAALGQHGGMLLGQRQTAFRIANATAVAVDAQISAAEQTFKAVDPLTDSTDFLLHELACGTAAKDHGGKDGQ